MKDIDLALFSGADIPIEGIDKLILHQPSIKEISMIGEKQFFSGVRVLIIDKSDLSNQGERDLSNTTNFQIFMTIMREEKAKESKQAVKEVFSLIIPNAQIIFSPRALLINCGEYNITIDEENFEIFQNVLRQVFCLKKDEEHTKLSGKKAAAIAEKIKKGKAKVAEIKGDTVGSVYARYLSSLSVGLKFPLSELLNYTIYQIHDLLERFSLWTSWDIDIRSRLAGADVKDKPEDWMKNIHKD